MPEAASLAPDEAPDGAFTLLDRAGARHVLPGVEGMSLMEILFAAGQPVAATCGGAAACGTCHIFVRMQDLARLDPVGEAERFQIEHLQQAGPGSRLACQILWCKARLDGLEITLAPRE